MEGRFDWGRYDFRTFRRRDVLAMGRFDCKAPFYTTNNNKNETKTTKQPNPLY